MNKSRIAFLAVMALGAVGYTIWTLSLMGFVLMAESGGKNPNSLLAAAELWSVGELFWTVGWGIRHAKKSKKSRQRALGDLLFVAALIGSPLLTLGMSDNVQWEWAIGIPLAITIVGCWITRILWKQAEKQQTKMAGLG